MVFAVVAAFVAAPSLSTSRVADAQSPPSWTLLVANREDATVSPVEVATKAVGAPVDLVDRTPEGIAITPDGATAFVAGATGVTPVDVEARTAGQSIDVAGNPDGVAITPDGTTAFVTANSAGTLVPIDVATRSAGPPITVVSGGGATGVAITPDGRTAFVTDNGGGMVVPVDIATRTPGAPIPVGPNPDGPAITPDGATLFVANGDPEAPGTVTPVDVESRTAGTPIPVLPLATTVAITPDGATALAASVVPLDDAPPDSANVVTPIDVATRTAGPPIPVDPRPSSIAITPDGATAFVGNFTFEGTPLTTIQPIDLATRTAGAPITVGRNPSALAITPDQAPVAKLSVTPGFAGQPTAFDAAASTVRFGTIASYVWDFGDGSPPVTTSTPTSTHAYAAPGSYTARVTETDSAGTSTTKVFTGQTMSRRGDPSAIATAIVQVLAVPRFTG